MAVVVDGLPSGSKSRYDGPPATDDGGIDQR
jgi:hypothetical protein